VNENGKKEESSSYASNTTEDRKPTHTGPFPDSSKSIWRSVFYPSGAIHAAEVSIKVVPLSMGWLKSKTCAVPYFISYSKEKG